MVAECGNEFRDLYYGSFPVVNHRKGKRDVEKPWLDDLDFKQLVEEKVDLYSRKLQGQLTEEGARLREVWREVNGARPTLIRG